jgi:TolA-binding protein
MSELGCERAWQAEAVEDGRLSAADRVSFERHASQCEICTAEVRALAELRQLAERLPVRTSRALDLRRRRNELLRRANELSLHPSRSSRKWPLVFAFAAAAATFVLAFWPRHQEPGPAIPALVTGVPSYRITPSPGSEWRTLERSSTLRLALRSGRFELQVDKLEQRQRFLLELPDGELEVKGTRFIVDADGVRTQSVRVLEGRVALRLHGREPLLLDGGQSWPESPAPEALAPEAPAPAAPPSASVPERASEATAERTLPKRNAVTPVPASAGGIAGSARSVGSAEAKPVAPGSNATPTAASDFAQSVAAFTAGDYGRAEQLLNSFEAHHPSDARVEDATFLRAVARSRRGDSAGARALAREYLRRYPNGLRHLEAQRLAR